MGTQSPTTSPQDSDQLINTENLSFCQDGHVGRGSAAFGIVDEDAVLAGLGRKPDQRLLPVGREHRAGKGGVGSSRSPPVWGFSATSMRRSQRTVMRSLSGSAASTAQLSFVPGAKARCRVSVAPSATTLTFPAPIRGQRLAGHFPVQLYVTHYQRGSLHSEERYHRHFLAARNFRRDAPRSTLPWDHVGPPAGTCRLQWPSRPSAIEFSRPPARRMSLSS